MSKPITKEAARKRVLDHMHMLAEFWATQERDPLRMCEGLAFSILNIFDGTTGLPAIDLVLRPHPDDKEFHKKEGEDYFVDGMVINDDCLLHDNFYPPCSAVKSSSGDLQLGTGDTGWGASGQQTAKPNESL